MCPSCNSRPALREMFISALTFQGVPLHYDQDYEINYLNCIREIYNVYLLNFIFFFFNWVVWDEFCWYFFNLQYILQKAIVMWDKLLLNLRPNVCVQCAWPSTYMVGKENGFTLVFLAYAQPTENGCSDPWEWVQYPSRQDNTFYYCKLYAVSTFLNLMCACCSLKIYEWCTHVPAINEKKQKYEVEIIYVWKFVLT